MSLNLENVKVAEGINLAFEESYVNVGIDSTFIFSPLSLSLFLRIQVEFKTDDLSLKNKPRIERLKSFSWIEKKRYIPKD